MRNKKIFLVSLILSFHFLVNAEVTSSIVAQTSPSSNNNEGLKNIEAGLGFKETALIKACKQGSIEEFHKIEKSDSAQLSQTDKQGLSLLMISILHQQNNITKYLLTKKIDFNHQSQNQETALSMAIANDQPEVAQALIDMGVQLVGKCGRKDLFICAVTMNDFKTTKILLQKNKDLIFQKNEKNENVLFEAVRYGTNDIVKWLLEQKQIPLSEKNYDGKTVLDLAQQMDRAEIIPFLSEK